MRRWDANLDRFVSWLEKRASLVVIGEYVVAATKIDHHHVNSQNFVKQFIGENILFKQQNRIASANIEYCTV